MKLPEKYSYLKLLDKNQQIILLELLRNREIRTSKFYRMGIFKSYNTLYKSLEELIDRDILRRTEHNKKNITYSLTIKGLSLAYLIASDERLFNTHIKDIIFVINVGHTIPDLLKKFLEYRLDVDGF
jgi:DNA-binding HxlR family transcriptional regulator